MWIQSAIHPSSEEPNPIILDFDKWNDGVWRDVGKDDIEEVKWKIDFYFGDMRDFMFPANDFDR